MTTLNETDVQTDLNAVNDQLTKLVDELNKIFETNPEALTSKSERAHGLVGVWGVAEPSALLSSGAKDLIVTRKQTSRATIAVARKTFS